MRPATGRSGVGLGFTLADAAGVGLGVTVDVGVTAGGAVTVAPGDSVVCGPPPHEAMITITALGTINLFARNQRI